MTYTHTYASDPNVRKSNEYKRAIRKMSYAWPETGLYVSPTSGIVMLRLAWFVFKKKEKSKIDKRFLFFQSLSTFTGLVFILNLMHVWFKSG